MYQSKKLAGNSHHFYEKGMNTDTFDSLIIENALYKAIDNKELVIVLFTANQLQNENNQRRGGVN